MTFNPVDFKEDCADDINNDEEPDIMSINKFHVCNYQFSNDTFELNVWSKFSNVRQIYVTFYIMNLMKITKPLH